LTFSKKKE